VCCFENDTARISAYDIHERIHNNLNLKEEEGSTVQLDEPKRQGKEEENLHHNGLPWECHGPCSEKPEIKCEHLIADMNCFDAEN
jgi:hypothetical protein